MNGRAVVELVSLAGAATPAATLDGNGGHCTVDFGGQYLMGRMLVTGNGGELYNRAVQRQVLAEVYPVADQDPETFLTCQRCGFDFLWPTLLAPPDLCPDCHSACGPLEGNRPRVDVTSPGTSFSFDICAVAMEPATSGAARTHNAESSSSPVMTSMGMALRAVAERLRSAHDDDCGDGHARAPDLGARSPADS